MSRHCPRRPQGTLGEKAVDNQRLRSEGIVGGEKAEREQVAVRSASSSPQLSPPVLQCPASGPEEPSGDPLGSQEMDGTGEERSWAQPPTPFPLGHRWPGATDPTHSLLSH